MADRNGVLGQHAGNRLAGEPTPLIRVENLRPAMLRQGFLQRLDVRVGLHRDRYTVGKNAPAEPLILSLSKDDDGDEIDEAARHRNIGDVRGPHLVGTLDRHAAQKIGIDLVSIGSRDAIRSGSLWCRL